MAVIEQDVVLTTKDRNGNTIIQMPITRAENIENVMSIEQGGTGATTVAAARNALGLGNTSGAVPIANGGTGATTAEGARTNLGITNDNVPVGTIMPFSGNTVPTGYLTCNGVAVSRATYADLFAVIGTTYGAGNGSTTFNLPNLNNNSFLEGSDTVGTVKGAGLPNITGLMSMQTNGHVGFERVCATGAFYENDATPTGTSWANRLSSTSSNADRARSLGLDASNSSSIYGNSDTVQPKSVTVKYIIKAFASITNGGNVNAENIMSAVESIQADIAKVNGITDYIIESYRNGTEWYEVYKSGKIRQGGFMSTVGINKITLLKPYSNKNYVIKPIPYTDGNVDNNFVVAYALDYSSYPKTNNSFYLYGHDAAWKAECYAYWECEGV